MSRSQRDARGVDKELGRVLSNIFNVPISIHRIPAPSRVHCRICSADIPRGRYANHLKTKRHARNLAKSRKKQKDKAGKR